MSLAKFLFVLTIAFSLYTEPVFSFNIKLKIHNNYTQSVTISNQDKIYEAYPHSTYYITALNSSDPGTYFKIATPNKTFYLHVEAVPLSSLRDEIVEISLTDENSYVYDSYAVKTKNDIIFPLDLSPNSKRTAHLRLPKNINKSRNLVLEEHKGDIFSGITENTTITFGRLAGNDIEVDGCYPTLLTVDEDSNRTFSLCAQGNLKKKAPTLSIQSLKLPISEIPFIHASLVDENNTHRGSIGLTFPDTTPSEKRYLALGTNEDNQLLFKRSEKDSLLLYSDNRS